MELQEMSELKAASLITVGNLPDKTRFTFANSIRGVKIFFGGAYEIKRFVILETEESMQCTDERSQVIRSILGPQCTIVSTPCLDDFRVRAFQTVAEELQRKDIQELVVDISNGRRTQTFDLIVATSICRIDNVVMTSVPRECFNKPYDELDDSQYSLTKIKPFSQDRSLEAAAQFELIYYTDRIRELIKIVRDLPSNAVSGYADTIESRLTNAIMNYFSDEPENFVNGLRTLTELQEGIANRLQRELTGGRSDSRFAEAVQIIKSKLSEPARTYAAEEDQVDEDRLAGVMLADLLDFCREFRNYVAHPYQRRIGRAEVQLMIFSTFTILEQIAAVVSWLAKGKTR